MQPRMWCGGAVEGGSNGCCAESKKSADLGLHWRKVLMNISMKWIKLLGGEERGNSECWMSCSCYANIHCQAGLDADEQSLGN